MKENNGKFTNLILSVLPIAVILLVWQVGAMAVSSEYILPDLGETLLGVVSVFGQKIFYTALLGTLLRTVIAFAISFILAFFLAFLSRVYKSADIMIAPVISVLRALPTIAVVLILLTWTNSNVASVVVTSLVVLPTAYSSLRDALFGVDDDFVRVLKLYGVSQKELLKKVYLPNILPNALLAIGSGLSLNLKLMVAAEVIAATANSLGYMLNSSKWNLETANMIAIVVVTVVIGLLVEWAFTTLSKKVGEWQ